MRVALYAIIFSALAIAQKIPDKSLLPKPTEITADYTKIKAGQHVCVFPISPSKEGHAWIGEEGFYFSQHCIFKALRLSDGWRVHLDGIGLYESTTTDRWYKTHGYVMMTEVSQ